MEQAFNNELIPSFAESIFTDIKDPLIDTTEIGLDAIIKQAPALSAIPIVGWCAAAYEVSKSIQAMNFRKQTLIFIKELNSGKIDAQKLSAYREMLTTNSKKAEEELGRVILILNSTIDEKQTIVLASLFRRYINELISWDKFVELSEINKRMLVADYSILRDYKEEKAVSSEYPARPDYQMQRLLSLGLLIDNVSGPSTFGTITMNSHTYTISSLGTEFSKSL